MTVGELMGRINARELTEWSAYETVTGPIGPERADLHAAMIAAAITNAMGGKAGNKPATPDDFMPVWDEQARAAGGRPQQTTEEQITMARALIGRRPGSNGGEQRA
jgi:hypothetical protein